MRNSIALALVLSLMLIGTAAWTRSEKTSREASPSLLGVRGSENFNQRPSLDIESFLSNEGIASEDIELTNTSILSRRLLSDYISLSTNGSASEASITELALQYVESVPNLVQAPQISALDVKVVPNTQINFSYYSSDILAIETEHQRQITDASEANPNLTALTSDLYSVILEIGDIYANTANKLKTIPVPASLAQNHADLINNYMLSSAALRAIAETETDPASAFAGITIMSTQVEEAKTILKEMDKILAENGI